MFIPPNYSIILIKNALHGAQSNLLSPFCQCNHTNDACAVSCGRVGSMMPQERHIRQSTTYSTLLPHNVILWVSSNLRQLLSWCMSKEKKGGIQLLQKVAACGASHLWWVPPVPPPSHPSLPSSDPLPFPISFCPPLTDLSRTLIDSPNNSNSNNGRSSWDVFLFF